jgi:hypothetical protein
VATTPPSSLRPDPFPDVLHVDARHLVAAGGVDGHHVEALRALDDEEAFEAVDQVQAEFGDVAAVDVAGFVRLEAIADERAGQDGARI